jgi:hypothetical protein
VPDKTRLDGGARGHQQDLDIGQAMVRGDDLPERLLAGWVHEQDEADGPRLRPVEA